MSGRKTTAWIMAGMMLVGAGCATQKPVLYPNEKLTEAGPAASEQDIADCLALSKQAGLETHAGKRTAKQTAGAAAVGAAAGGAAGALSRGETAGSGAAAGAAGAAAATVVRGVFRSGELDPVQKRFVEECLREKGYRVIGWK